MTSARDVAQQALRAGKMTEVDASGHSFYAASNFASQDWRVYEVSESGDRWIMRLVGSGAEVKAKAIAMILNAEPD